MDNGESFGVAFAKRWSLAGATALVTGGTKGIGFSVVQELAQLGAAVHTCSRNEAELNKCLQRWQGMTFKVTGSVCDVTSAADRVRLMQDVNAVFDGKLNILVNNAGTGILKPFMEYTEEDYKYIMTTNVESSWHLSQLGYPLLKASGRGNIVFNSSVAGILARFNVALYGMSKAALNHLTMSLAVEWAKDNIRTNAVAPGLLQNKEFTAHEFSTVPLGRVAEPEEVAATIAFLCLPTSAYITGQVVVIDGGRAINGY